MSHAEVLQKVKEFGAKHVLITGGEPLLQRGTLNLIQLLNQEGFLVSVETHGEVSIEAASPHARIVMDIKTPGSQMNRGHYLKNLEFLKPNDEIKFVITSEEDYIWSREVVKETLLKNPRTKNCEILFSPVLPSHHSPKPITGMDPTRLAEWILRDKLPVRFQYQLHKLLWGLDKTGV